MATSRTGMILVVDDEEIMREILETLLTREGYTVRLASSGAEGLELARAMPFDAAIVDIMMPGIRRHRHARRAEAHRRGSRGAHHHRVRVGRERDFGDEGGRLRLHHQAVQERRSPRRRPQRDGAAAAGAREPQPAAEHPGALPQVREHHREEPADAAGVRPDYSGGAEPVDDSHAGRERHGQGAGGASHPRQLVPLGAPVRHRQLGESAAGSARVDAVRPREGRVHRRRVAQEGPVRSRGHRQHLLRRNRQCPARDAGQAAARHPGARFHAPGRPRHDQGGRPHHRGHQCRPEADDRRGPVPRGFVLSPERHLAASCHRCAIARTTFRCSPGTSCRNTATKTGRAASS